MRRLRMLLAALSCSLLLPAVGWAQAASAAPPASTAAAPAPLPPSLPLRRDAPGSDSGFGWQAPALLVLLLAAGGALWLHRRGSAGWLRLVAVPSGGVVRLASQPLTPQASVHAVRWHGEELLLGCTSQAVTVLARHALPADEGSAP